MTRTGFDRGLIPPLILGSLLNPVNSSMLAVALVPIGIAFGAPPAETAYLVSALYLATAIAQPVLGRLVDLYGARRLYLAGTALVGVAGVLAAFAPSLGWLVVSRVLLGIGTCAAYPSAMHLIRREADRSGLTTPAGVLTMLSVATQTVVVIGPTLGGVLVGVGGWRAIFTVNVPLAIACLVLGWMRLPRERTVPTGPGRTDPPGMVLFAATLLGLMLFLMRPQPAHWYLVALAVLAAVGLVVRERRAAEPFVDLRVLAGNRPLLATYSRQVLSYVVSYALLYGYTLWLQQTRGLSPTVAGLMLLPMSAVAIGVSAATGRRPELRGKLLAGSVALVAVCALLLTLDARSPIWLIVVIAALAGVPQGLNNLANQNALYAQADPERMGSSAGLLRTCMYLGAIVSSAVTAAAFPVSADTPGLHVLALVMGGCAVALLALVVVDRSLPARVSRSTA
ncbi:MFS transporter [Pseudonocardia endophytica]|uniref:MFS transporter n=1 Tax=Pseudonocardia endophytica TaxID=401976 RepID=A0A4R1HKM1_PSEEN|nr:MFS transporter [Pseudonocardia endophytica]TCK20830.1 MFS transporter [Pseudonocardia endophytica]